MSHHVGVLFVIYLFIRVFTFHGNMNPFLRRRCKLYAIFFFFWFGWSLQLFFSVSAVMMMMKGSHDSLQNSWEFHFRLECLCIFFSLVSLLVEWISLSFCIYLVTVHFFTYFPWLIFQLFSRNDAAVEDT